MRLNPGDRVNCRIKEGLIVGSYSEHDEIKTFEVLASGEYGYYLFVPVYYAIKNTITIDKRTLRKHSIDARFLDEEMIHVHENMICEVTQQIDGMSCVICKEFVPMAEANQEDGTLICYCCRQNPYH